MKSLWFLALAPVGGYCVRPLVVLLRGSLGGLLGESTTIGLLLSGSLSGDWYCRASISSGCLMIPEILREIQSVYYKFPKLFLGMNFLYLEFLAFPGSFGETYDVTPYCKQYGLHFLLWGSPWSVDGCDQETYSFGHLHL